MSSADAIQVGGNHYKKGGEFQHWNVAAANGWGYFESAITKYVTRWRDKDGIQGLEKGLHYLDKLIELAEVNRASPVQTHTWLAGAGPFINLWEFADANNLGADERRICGLVGWTWPEFGSVEHLREAREQLAALIEQAKRQSPR